MANIRPIIRKGKTDNETTIYIRFTEGRNHDYTVVTKHKIKPSQWNNEKNKVRRIAEVKNRDEINNYLNKICTHLNEQFVKDYNDGVLIDSDWLKTCFEKYHNQDGNKKEDVNLNVFVNYCKYYINNLPNKLDKKTGRLGASQTTIWKYNNVLNKIINYQKHAKKQLHLLDINDGFQVDYINYLKEVEKLSINTIGRNIVYIKTICNDAVKKGYQVSPQLIEITGFKEKTKFIYFNENEIEEIINFDFSKTPYLDNARDWLIVGLHTGQRVSDFMKFKKTTIKGDFLEFTQEKTKALTIVPVHDNLKKILIKNNGDFPRKISDQRFNDYIKEVCERVGFTQLVEGAKINPQTKRKESGMYAKYELVTSHICRRSFATNHYGKLPTPIIMSITNHSTEKMFL
ncbi:MAG: site-specific integrase, partial [Cyclobacteriaceae bacterium]|nr:site-specific integrase [Cyclobacteriaceae bacterium]